jgi:hypothetical protein
MSNRKCNTGEHGQRLKDEQKAQKLAVSFTSGRSHVSWSTHRRGKCSTQRGKSATTGFSPILLRRFLELSPSCGRSFAARFPSTNPAKA